jgi:hypothetical protein
VYVWLLLNGTSASATTNPLLSVSASPVTLPSQVKAGSTVSANLGSLAIADLLGDSTTWTLTVGATDCVPTSLSGINVSATDVPVGDISITPAKPTVVTPDSLHEVGPVAGPGGTFTFNSSYADNSPGTSTSAPLVIASDSWATGDGPGDNDGQFAQTNSLSIQTPTTMIAGTYTCTLQYTITG